MNQHSLFIDVCPYLKTLLVQITRTRHELANVRRQVDVAKLRLTTDIKVC